MQNDSLLGGTVPGNSSEGAPRREQWATHWFLNGFFEAGCHGKTAFSTYHNIRAGRCDWCQRSEAELINAGAVWMDILGNRRDEQGQ